MPLMLKLANCVKRPEHREVRSGLVFATATLLKQQPFLEGVANGQNDEGSASVHLPVASYANVRSAHLRMPGSKGIL